MLAQLISRRRRSRAAVCAGYKAVRPYVSYIQPSFKWLGKVRAVVRVIRRYSPSALLCDRVLKYGETSVEVAGSSEDPGRSRPGGAVSPHQGGAVYDGGYVLVSAPGNSPRNMSSLE